MTYPSETKAYFRTTPLNATEMEVDSPCNSAGNIKNNTSCEKKILGNGNCKYTRRPIRQRKADQRNSFFCPEHQVPRSSDTYEPISSRTRLQARKRLSNNERKPEGINQEEKRRDTTYSSSTNKRMGQCASGPEVLSSKTNHFNNQPKRKRPHEKEDADISESASRKRKFADVSSSQQKETVGPEGHNLQFDDFWGPVSSRTRSKTKKYHSPDGQKSESSNEKEKIIGTASSSEANKTTHEPWSEPKPQSSGARQFKSRSEQLLSELRQCPKTNFFGWLKKAIEGSVLNQKISDFWIPDNETKTRFLELLVKNPGN